MMLRRQPSLAHIPVSPTLVGLFFDTLIRSTIAP